MNLYLLRHGEAEARQYDDPQRALTGRGKLEVRDVARQFAARKVPLDLCLHSPYLRTTQTAEVFMAELGSSLRPLPQPVLTPEHRAFKVLDHLRTLQVEHVLLVTHNPLVSELYAVLTGADMQIMHVFGTSELNAVHCDVVDAGCGAGQFRLQARV
ncbi:MAG: phosphohistidine phosphatase SixA [Pseudomonadota bacterium]